MPAKFQPSLLRALVAGDAEEDRADFVEFGPEHVDQALAVEEVLGPGEDGDGEDADDVRGLRVDGRFGDELAEDFFGELV